MFKPISNPYIVGNPIKSADMFFGRQDDFDFIKRKLETGEKSYIIVLCGERRSGKTSILFQILSGRLGEEFIPILVDMQTMAGLKNEREFFEKFAQETLKYINQKIDINEFFKTRDSSFKAFASFLSEIHKQNSGKHILFLIDEYELIEAKINEGSLNENFIPFLAGLLEGDQLISFIFTGSTKLEERKSKMWQILFAKSLFRNVSYLSRDDSLRLIQEPVKDQIEYDLVVLNIIYRLTSGQPFYTQVVCQNIVDYVNQKQQTTIQEEDLDIIVNEILENPLPQMIYFWNSQSDDRKLILSLMAEILDDPNAWINAEQIIKESKQRKFGLDLTVKSINMTLETLFHSQYLGKSQVGYKFQMDLFRRWIKRDHAIWRVMKEVSSLGLASSVEKQVFQDDQPREKKSSKGLIYALAAVVIIALAGWFIFMPGGQDQEKLDGTSAAAPNEINDTQQENITQPPEQSPESKKQSEPAQDATADKDQVAESTQKTQNTADDAPKKKIASKPKNEQKPPQTKPKIDFAAKSGAEGARSQMTKARQSAINVNADRKAASIFTEAQSSENEGNASFAQNNFTAAKTAFSEATRLYNEAVASVNEKATSAKKEAESARAKMAGIKSKVADQYKDMPAYNTALTEEKQGNSFFTNNDFSQAAESYQKASNEYEQAIAEYDAAKNSVTKLVNNYLDGIENESIAQMKQNHKNFSKDLESSWQQYFKVADNINVKRKIKSLNLDSQSANVDVEVQLSFSGSGSSPLNNWLFNLEKISSNWIITDITEGN